MRNIPLCQSSFIILNTKGRNNMIIIGEKLNGAIPAVKTAITERNAQLIRSRATAQEQAGAHFIDCATGTAPELEYDAMVWMIGQIQSVTEKPVCIDSPDAALLARILEEGHAAKPGSPPFSAGLAHAPPLPANTRFCAPESTGNCTPPLGCPAPACCHRGRCR